MRGTHVCSTRQLVGDLEKLRITPARWLDGCGERLPTALLFRGDANAACATGAATPMIGVAYVSKSASRSLISWMPAGCSPAAVCLFLDHSFAFT
jgi:hypothetical protein